MLVAMAQAQASHALQPSQEDLELAENLNLLNHADSRQSELRESEIRQQGTDAHVHDNRSPIQAHSMADMSDHNYVDDEINGAAGSRSPSLSQNPYPGAGEGAQVNVALLTGQTCRYVTSSAKISQTFEQVAMSRAREEG
jgi:hypothetical protein